MLKTTDADPFLRVSVNDVRVAHILDTVAWQDVRIHRCTDGQSVRHAEDSSIL